MIQKNKKIRGFSKNLDTSNRKVFSKKQPKVNKKTPTKKEPLLAASSEVVQEKQQEKQVLEPEYAGGFTLKDLERW